MRVLKPGGHLLAFSGSRTYHRMTCAIEDAGFEIRDQIQWLYGSGFPKSLDVSKAINKAAGAQREVVGTRKVSESDLGQSSGWNSLDTSSGVYNYTAPATANAKLWEGWGTSLKPAHEPICVARKPLTGTVAANVLAHGTGALNVDASRIGDAKRWPANIIHDGSDLVEAEFALYGTRKTGDLKPYKRSNQAGCAALCRKKATLTARATAAARRASSTAQRLARQIAVPATIIQR